MSEVDRKRASALESELGKPVQAIITLAGGNTHVTFFGSPTSEMFDTAYLDSLVVTHGS